MVKKQKSPLAHVKAEINANKRAITAKKQKSALDLVREEVMAKHRAATAKVSRNEQKGIKLADSQFDVRRDVRRIKSYNKRQLDAYLRELVGFNSRKTQFEALAGGKPTTRQAANRYHRAENRVNEIGKAHDASKGDIFIPYSGQTVAQRAAGLHPLSQFDRDTPRPYSQINRNLANVEGHEALEKLTRQLERKFDKDRTIRRSLRTTRRNFKKILKEMGAADLAAMVNKLTTAQADVLFNYSPLPDIINLGYGDWKEFRAGGKEAEMAAVVNDQRQEVVSIIEWAATLPRK